MMADQDFMNFYGDGRAGPALPPYYHPHQTQTYYPTQMGPPPPVEPPVDQPVNDFFNYLPAAHSVSTPFDSFVTAETVQDGQTA